MTTQEQGDGWNVSWYIDYASETVDCRTRGEADKIAERKRLTGFQADVASIELGEVEHCGYSASYNSITNKYTCKQCGAQLHWNSLYAEPAEGTN